MVYSFPLKTVDFAWQATWFNLSSSCLDAAITFRLNVFYGGGGLVGPLSPRRTYNWAYFVLFFDGSINIHVFLIR